MYIETSSPRVTGDIARLISPIYQDTDAVCLTFWYHMYGNGIGTLRVYAKVCKHYYHMCKKGLAISYMCKKCLAFFH